MEYSLKNSNCPISVRRPPFLVILMILMPFISEAQVRDTNYIEPYHKMLTSRAYISRKYTIFSVQGTNGSKEIQYRPNTKTNLGVGATYRAFNISIGYGFDFINEKAEKGTTKYIDLQTRLYGVKWGVDLFGQFYKGYHIFPKGFGINDKDLFYIRPDLRVREIGVSAFHIYNNKKFSYRAAFLQSELQKKSAGSFLLGGSIVFGNINADSAFVPSLLANEYPQKDVHLLRYVEMGPGAGYSYTFVYKEHWYLSATSTLSLNFGLVQETSPTATFHSNHIAPNIILRIGTGYNSDTWNFNFAWVSNRTAIEGIYHKAGYNVNTGTYRFSVGKRFKPNKGLRKGLQPIDKLLDK